MRSSSRVGPYEECARTTLPHPRSQELAVPPHEGEGK